MGVSNSNRRGFTTLDTTDQVQFIDFILLIMMTMYRALQVFLMVQTAYLIGEYITCHAPTQFKRLNRVGGVTCSFVYNIIVRGRSLILSDYLSEKKSIHVAQSSSKHVYMLLLLVYMTTLIDKFRKSGTRGPPIHYRYDID